MARRMPSAKHCVESATYVCDTPVGWTAKTFSFFSRSVETSVDVFTRRAVCENVQAVVAHSLHTKHTRTPLFATVNN